jgi:hypothetical protein
MKLPPRQLMQRPIWGLILFALALLACVATLQAAPSSTSTDVTITVTHGGSVAATDLGVTPDGHHLSKGGSPFFFLSDTEWVLNERTDSDVTTLLDDRAAKGFSVVQVFATRYWDPAVRTDVNGNYPFVNNAKIGANRHLISVESGR